MAGITFDDLEDGHHYSMVEPTGDRLDAGRLYKIQHYNKSNDDYVKIIYTRNLNDGSPIYMEAIVKVIPGTIFHEEVDVDTDPELPDDKEEEFFNMNADDNFKAGLKKAFNEVEHPKGREVEHPKGRGRKKQRSKKQKSKKKRSKKTKKTRK